MKPKRQKATAALRMSRAKFAAFAVLTVLLSIGGTLLGVLGVDLYLHHKFEKVAGLNIRGYRGPLLGRKQPGEQRIVVLGGSTTFGYGVTSDQAWPAQLERILNARRAEQGAGPVRVANLGYNNEGAHSFLYTLQDYENLEYDVALLYTGDNDLGINTQVFRRQSAIFRLTGYYLLLPVVFKEKAMALRSNGQLEMAYWPEHYGNPVFSPNLAERTTASALEAAVQLSKSLERQLGRLSDPEHGSVEASAAVNGCAEEWKYYCQGVFAAVDHAVNRGKRVVVVSEPYVADQQISQQRSIVAMLKEHFGAQPLVTHVDLGRAIAMKDTTLVWDGMHLTAAGNRRIAEQLAPALASVLQ